MCFCIHLVLLEKEVEAIGGDKCIADKAPELRCSRYRS